MIGLETGNEAFDREFVVRCAAGAAAALSVLSPRVRAAIVSSRDLPVACQGRDVLSWSPGSFTLEHVRRVLGFAVLVAADAASR